MRTRRRSLIAAASAVAGSLAFGAGAAGAQAPRPPQRIGVLTLADFKGWQRNVALMEAGLRKQGLIVGRDVVFDYRHADNDAARLPALAADLAASRPALMFCAGNNVCQALVETPGQTPVVGIGGAGLMAGAKSMGRPGGRATGVTIAAVALNSKRQEFVAMLCAKGGTLAILGEPHTRAAVMPQLEAEARQLGMKPLALYADGADDVDAAFARMRAERACALNVLESPILSGLMSRIVQRAHEHRLPAIVQWPEQVHAGALMGYGPERQGAYDQAMEKAARVLRGEKPGDIPIEQPLLFRLAVNQRLAREMGLKLPAALLARADEVVE